MAQHNLLGKRGEEEALRHLISKGYRVVEKNWRTGKAEVDLICEKDGSYVFVEVKCRSTDYFGEPEESVSEKKQRMLANAADIYMNEKNINAEVRFDVISIILDRKVKRINHIEDAFYPFDGGL